MSDDQSGVTPGGSDAFALDVPVTRAAVDAEHPDAELEINVTNALGRRVRTSVEVRPETDGGPAPSWITLEPSTFDLDLNASQRVVLRIAVPSDAPAGEYRVTPRVYDVDRPADAFAVSPPVTIAVADGQSNGPPWWIFAIVAALLLVIIGFIVWYLTIRGGGATQPEPSATPDATESEPAQPVASAPVVVRLEQGPAFQRGFFTPSGSIVTGDSGILDDEVEARWTVGGEEHTSGTRVVERVPESGLALLELTDASGASVQLPVGSLEDVDVTDTVVLYLGPARRAELDVLEIGASADIMGQRLTNLLSTTNVDDRGILGAPILTTDGQMIAMVFGGSPDALLSIAMTTVVDVFGDEFE